MNTEKPSEIIIADYRVKSKNIRAFFVAKAKYALIEDMGFMV